MDHLGGNAIRRSPKCELLVDENKENDDPWNECRFCALGDVDMTEVKDPSSVGLLDPDHVVKVEPGRQHNRRIFGLSFGLKNGLRVRFNSETCLNNQFLNISLV